MYNLLVLCDLLKSFPPIFLDDAFPGPSQFLHVPAVISTHLKVQGCRFRSSEFFFSAASSSLDFDLKTSCLVLPGLSTPCPKPFSNGFPLPILLPGNSLKEVRWENYRAHFTNFSSPRDHCPLLLDVQHLKKWYFTF